MNITTEKSGGLLAGTPREVTGVAMIVMMIDRMTDTTTDMTIGMMTDTMTELPEGAVHQMVHQDLPLQEMDPLPGMNHLPGVNRVQELLRADLHPEAVHHPGKGLQGIAVQETEVPVEAITVVQETAQAEAPGTEETGARRKKAAPKL